MGTLKGDHTLPPEEGLPRLPEDKSLLADLHREGLRVLARLEAEDRKAPRRKRPKVSPATRVRLQWDELTLYLTENHEPSQVRP